MIIARSPKATVAAFFRQLHLPALRVEGAVLECVDNFGAHSFYLALNLAERSQHGVTLCPLSNVAGVDTGCVTPIDRCNLAANFEKRGDQTVARSKQSRRFILPRAHDG
ncbi:hypothetical protein [Mesorhizobium sp. Z1-4]|uniref:hypothetical protein n=1 Tax=Mesorhizobium sp. Z1-4 TaxID=2448478 RepID=UPI000FD7C080|nr:hypothetical protein [Mesorhizobium sp. Z1-4]